MSSKKNSEAGGQTDARPQVGNKIPFGRKSHWNRAKESVAHLTRVSSHSGSPAIYDLSLQPSISDHNMQDSIKSSGRSKSVL